MEDIKLVMVSGGKMKERKSDCKGCKFYRYVERIVQNEYRQDDDYSWDGCIELNQEIEDLNVGKKCTLFKKGKPRKEYE
jgi:hypothetical protein